MFMKKTLPIRLIIKDWVIINDKAVKCVFAYINGNSSSNALYGIVAYHCEHENATPIMLNGIQYKKKWFDDERFASIYDEQRILILCGLDAYGDIVQDFMNYDINYNIFNQCNESFIVLDVNRGTQVCRLRSSLIKYDTPISGFNVNFYMGKKNATEQYPAGKELTLEQFCDLTAQPNDVMSHEAFQNLRQILSLWQPKA